MPVEQTLPAADFQSLPLDFLIAAPLVAAVQAQKQAALSTKDFITSFLNEVKGADDKPSGRFTPQTANFDFSFAQTGADGKAATKTVKLDVPLLSIVPVPHLRIDSLTTHFKYEVSQVVGTERKQATQGELNAGIKYLPFLEASLKGSLSSTSAEHSTTNRSGLLEITVHASEAPMPEGLARLLSLLAKVVDVQVAP